MKCFAARILVEACSEDEDDNRFERWLNANGVNCIGMCRLADGTEKVKYFRDGIEITSDMAWDFDAVLTPYMKIVGNA